MTNHNEVRTLLHKLANIVTPIDGYLTVAAETGVPLTSDDTASLQGKCSEAFQTIRTLRQLVMDDQTPEYMALICELSSATAGNPSLLEKFVELIDSVVHCNSISGRVMRFGTLCYMQLEGPRNELSAFIISLMEAKYAGDTALLARGVIEHRRLKGWTKVGDLVAGDYPIPDQLSKFKSEVSKMSVVESLAFSEQLANQIEQGILERNT